jgi:hypothetical protein
MPILSVGRVGKRERRNGLSYAARPGHAGGVKYWTRSRWAALAAGAMFVAGGAALGAGPYHDRQAFERAPYCGPTVRGDCVTRVRMTVVSRSTYTTEDPDPNWPPPQPPPQPPQPPPMNPFVPFGMGPARGPVRTVVAALPMSQTTHYKLTVRTEDGKAHTYQVGSDVYDAARTGATGTAEIWHGRIQRLRIGAHTSDQWSYLSLVIAWVLAWIGVMLIVGWGLPLADVVPPIVVGGWVAGVILFGALSAWAAAWWAVPLIVGGVVLLCRVYWTLVRP